MKGKDVIKKMEAAGWVEVYIKGSHHYFIHEGHPGKKVPVPVHAGKDLHPDTLASIKRDTGLKF